LNRSSIRLLSVGFSSLAVLLFVAAVAGVAALRLQVQSAPAGPHTTYFLHGRIYTNDPQHPWAAAIAVR
jgi:hypothetical protein